jgi:Fimbrial assembly protein (PilN)
MKNMINLLPASLRRQQMVRRRALQWSAIICVVLLFGWALHWYELSGQRAMSKRLEVLEREHRPTQTMLQQLVDMRQRLVDLQQQESIVRELEYQRNALSLLGVISQTAQKTNGRLRVANLTLTNFQSGQDSLETSTSGSNAAAGLVLTGVSLDNAAAAELLEGLQDSGIFRDVKLESLKEREDGGTSLRDYEVHCEF